LPPVFGGEIDDHRPGFIPGTAAAVMRIGAFFPGIAAVEIVDLAPKRVATAS